MILSRLSARTRAAILFFSFAALSVYLIEGSYYEDEVGQISAFTAYKFGQINGPEMRWEFQEKMRPWLQPAIYFILDYPFWMTGGYNYPLFEKISLLFQFVLLLFAIPLFIRRFSDDSKATTYFLFFFAALWFLPGLLVRHSSDALSTIAVVFSLLLLHEYENDRRKSFLKLLLGGMIAGLAFHLRYQVAFFYIGFVATHLVKAALGRQLGDSLKTNAIFSLGCLAGVAAGGAIDVWGYGKPVLAAFNYAWQNIVLKKAADFGKEGWYWYFTQIIAYTINPFIWVWFFAAVYLGRKNLFLTAISGGLIFFLAAHCLVDHKEVRFLLPMLGPFLLIFLRTLPSVEELKSGKWRGFWSACYSARALKILVVLNLAVLVVFTVVGSVRDKFRISSALWKLPQDSTVYTVTDLYARFDGAFSQKRGASQVGMMPFAKPPHIKLLFAETNEYKLACGQRNSAHILLTQNDRTANGAYLMEIPFRSSNQFPPEIFWRNTEWQRRMWRFKLVRCSDFLAHASELNL